MRRLEDKIALVTGAGAGIGRAIAETFAREGAHVIVADIDGEAAKQVADAIVKANGAASAQTVDVTDTAQVKALMEAINREHGRLDVLVNNAGVGARADFRHISDEDWDRVWAVNLDGTVRCAREAFDLMRASGKSVDHQSVVGDGGQAYAADGGLLGDQGRGLCLVAEPRRGVCALRHPREHGAAGLCGDGADRALLCRTR